ncbi:MAG: hypothetical protein HZT43_15760 [Exiguobacterium profundum]|nr:MAG: hypothetical protein HZT43_15760 [Exiguobacterium profundum]
MVAWFVTVSLPSLRKMLPMMVPALSMMSLAVLVEIAFDTVRHWMVPLFVRSSYRRRSGNHAAHAAVGDDPGIGNIGGGVRYWSKRSTDVPVVLPADRIAPELVMW